MLSIITILIMLDELSGRFSKSRTRRRWNISQPIVRSTIHLLGITVNPLTSEFVSPW